MSKSDTVEVEALLESLNPLPDPGGEVSSATAASETHHSEAVAAGEARVVGNSKKQHKRLIALFGSSLNPVTRGHVAIVDALLAEKRCWHLDENLSAIDSPGPGCDGCDEVEDPDRPLFDEVWVGPVYSHPDVEKYRHLERIADRTEEQQAQYVTFLKKQALKDSFDERVSLCRAAFRSRPRVKIHTFERDLWNLFPTYRPGKPGSPSCNLRTEHEKYPGTLHLIRWMLGVEKYEGDSTFAEEQENGTEFAWFMGQDTWESYVRGGWVGKYELQTRVRLVNAPRDGVPCGPLVPVPGTKPPIALDHVEVLPTSSTAARHAARRGDGKELRKQVPEAVAMLIEERDMFEVQTPRM